MSFRVVARVMDDTKQYNFGGTKLLVLLILASWADDEGEVVHGKATVTGIARAARISHDHAVRTLSNLVKEGHLNREFVPGKKSRLYITGGGFEATPPV